MAAQKRLNRDDVVTSALAVADAEGLDAVTIRRVAQLHGVTPMALYRHFPDKEGLLAAVAEKLLAETRLPEPDDRPWHEQLGDVLTGVLDALRAHPNAAGLLLSDIMASDPGLALVERILALLAEGGHTVDEAAMTGSQVLVTLVTMVISEPGRALTDDPEAHEASVRARRARLLSLPPSRYPHVVAAADALAECTSEEAYYHRGLTMLLSGLRTLPTTPHPPVHA
jgi:AcrR family transcriptional regulator